MVDSYHNSYDMSFDTVYTIHITSVYCIKFVSVSTVFWILYVMLLE